MDRPPRRLCVVFDAGATRYAVEAVRVREISRSEPTAVQPGPAMRDLAELLGGGAEERPGVGLVLDTGAGLPVRVRRVHGVYDCGLAPSFALQRRVIAALAPAVRGAFDFDGQLLFELDPDAVERGLPRQTRRLDPLRLEVPGAALVFESGGARRGVPLSHVVQVVARGPLFNAAPNAGAMLGAVAFRGALSAVYTLGAPGEAEAFIVLVESDGDVVGLSAARVDGVVAADRLGELEVLDPARLFS